MRVQDQEFYDSFEEEDANRIYSDWIGSVLRRIVEERIPAVLRNKKQKEEK